MTLRVISLRRRANARNVSFQFLYGGQFTLSTQLINPKFCVSFPHQRSTTVSLETNPLVCLMTLRLSKPRGATQQSFIRGGSAPRVKPLPFDIRFFPKWHPFHIPKANIAPLSYTSRISQNIRISYGRRVFPWAFSCPGSVTKGSICFVLLLLCT